MVICSPCIWEHGWSFLQTPKHEYHSMSCKCYKFTFVLEKDRLLGEGRRPTGTLSSSLLISPWLVPSLWHVTGMHQSPYQYCGCSQFTVCMLMFAATGIWNTCECSAHLKIRPFNSRHFKYRLRVLNLGMKVWIFWMRPLHQPAINSAI